MSHLKINTVKNYNSLSVQLIGQLDEDATLSSIEVSGSPNLQSLRIDWDGVKSINSCGIREWIKWIQNVPKDLRITFEKCPRIVVNQVNLVNGFLPKGALIQSLYVPYFCSACDAVTSILCSMEGSSTERSFSPPEHILCSKCNRETEMDVVLTKYFRFLKGEAV